MLFEFSSQLQVTGRLCRRVGEAPIKLSSRILYFFTWIPVRIEYRVIHAIAPKSLPCQLNSQFTGQLNKSVRMLACRCFRSSLNLAGIRIALAMRQYSQGCDRT